MQFYIMHVDIWSPKHLVDTKKDIIRLMNLMCNLTQFVISSVVWNINEDILVKTFMEELALSSVMTAVIVVGSDGKFRSFLRKCAHHLKYMYVHSLEVTTKDSQLRNITDFSKKHKQSWVRIEELIYLSYKIPKIPNMIGIAHQYTIYTYQGALLRWAENSNSP